MQNNNARDRDVERRLGRVESPEPPADLLTRIQGDIPDHLRPVGEAEDAKPARHGRRYQLLAASVFLALVGGVVAYRVFESAPEAPLMKSAPPTASATTEVGVETTETAAGTGAVPSARNEVYPASARAEDRSTDEAQVEQPAEKRPDIYGGRRDDPEPARLSATEVGVVTAAEAELMAQQQLERRATAVPLAEERERQGALGQVGETDRIVADKAAAPLPTPAIAEETIVMGRPQRQRLQERLRRAEIYVPPPVHVPGPSTGGTSEPNDQPWGDMLFRPYGTNPFVDTEDDPQSTFGLDVDTGSYTLARSYIDRGHLPPPEAVRVEEFVNFFDYRDPAPRRGEFTLTAEGAPSPWQRGPRYQLLRVGVRGRDISAAQRQDATLIFVVDVSGSMARGDRIQLVKRALHLLLDQLGGGDQVGLVVYGSQGRVLLEPSNDLMAVRRAIDRLSTGGSTNAEEGLLLGYELARRHFRPESINRLVLCSDGVANVGNTGPESILARVGREAAQGIELTTVGFGMGNYNDVLMEQLADQGDGNYAYVDTLQEARRVFVENLTGTLQTIASDAKIQVEFDPRAVTRYRLLGYENRDVADHRFRDDTVDAGEIGAGHRVTALYEIKLADDAPRRRALAEVRLRYRSKATGRVVEDALEIRPSELARSWRDASPSLRLAALAAELAEVLKRSYWAREIRPEELRDRARAVSRDSSGNRDVAELVRLTERVSDLVDWPEAPAE